MTKEPKALSAEELATIFTLLDGIQPGDWTIMYDRNRVAGGWSEEFPVRIHAYDVDTDYDGNARDYGADVCEIIDTQYDTANALLISKAPDALYKLRDHIASQQREIERLQFVPGVWRCAKCDFRLVQSTLNTRDGMVTPRDEPGEPCPNCAGPLWRVSWKQEAAENLTLAENQMKRAVEAEEAVAALRAENERLRGALERANLQLICRPHDGGDTAHYCPNCARSLYNVRETIRAVLSASGESET